MRRGYRLHRRSYTPYTAFSRSNPNEKFNTTFHVTLWVQPSTRYWIARIYYWYNIRIYKVPGFKLLERTLSWFHRKEKFGVYIPLSAQQDVKCYHLTNKKLEELVTFDLSVEQYKKLGGTYSDE